MKTVKVSVDHEAREIDVEVTTPSRVSRYVLGGNSYGNRRLPALLEQADHTTYNSGHKKGDRTPYVDSVCGGDVPASFTYMFKDKVCLSPHKGRESCVV